MSTIQNAGLPTSRWRNTLALILRMVPRVKVFGFVRRRIRDIVANGGNRMRACLLMLLLAGACAPLATQNQADAAFRKAIAAQIGGDADRAEAEYRRIINLGFNWSPVWN